MFEERYRKLYQDLTPSEQLNDETVDLMIEARNHRAKPLPERKSRLPMILSLSIGGGLVAACVVAIVVLAWFNRGTNIDETLGSMVLTPQTEQTTDTNTSAPETDEKTEEGEGAVDTDTPVPEIAIVPSESFSSFDTYFKALDEKKTIGYGENYFLCKEMIVYPDTLPKGAELIEILQYNDGQYEYSYRFEKEGEPYILTVRSQSTFPTSEEAMTAQLELIEKEEAPTFISNGDTRTYRFGKLDSIVVIVSREVPAADETPEDETSKDETSKDETSKDETSKDETSKGETSKDEASKDEASKDEASKDETTKDETAETETPEEETVESETPATEPTDDTAAVPAVAEEPTAKTPAADEGQSVEPYDPNASVSSPAMPAPLTQEEVDALLKDFALIRYLKK